MNLNPWPVTCTFFRRETSSSRLMPTEHKCKIQIYSITTYEEIVQFLIQKRYLLPLDPTIRYDLVLCSKMLENGYPPEIAKKTFGGYIYKPSKLKEGMTLDALFDLSRLNPWMSSVPISKLNCDISIELIPQPPSKKKSNSTSPNLVDTINAILTSTEVGIINFVGSAVTITTALIAIANWWSKKHSTENVSSQKSSSQLSGSEILAIRLQMTDGTEASFGEWVTDPDRFKHYIDVFLQPSASVKPLQVIFAMKNGKRVVVDVSKGTQQNIQLDELLTYLNVNSADKQGL